jgi:hypothetical protein
MYEYLYTHISQEILMSVLTNEDRRLMIEAVKEGVIAGAAAAAGTSRYSDTTSGGGVRGGGGSEKFNSGFWDSAKTAVGGVAQGFGALGGILKENVQDWQALSRTGASFNNNAMGMRDSIGQTRLSMDEYKAVMDKLSPSIAGLGGSVDQGTKNFNKFSGEFMSTPFSEQLTKMGYTTRELNDVMAANMANRRFTDLSDDLQRKKAIEATANLAREMDETAKLTGITRQEQMADLKSRTENGKVQAAIQLEMIRGGKDVEQNYADMTKRLDGLGKGVKDLADEMFTGGVRTEEGAAKMAALGPAGLELEKAVKASKNAKTQEEKDAAEAQMNRAKVAVNERMKSEEFLQAVMVAGGKVGPAMQKMYEENRLRAGTTATENRTGQTTAQAMSTNQAAAINQQQGRDEKGVKDEGSKTTEATVQLQNRLRDASTAWNTELNALNNAMLKMPEGTKLVNRLLSATAQQVDGQTIPQAGLGQIGTRANILLNGSNQAAGGSTVPGQQPTTAPNSRVPTTPVNPLGNMVQGLGGLFTTTPGSVRVANPQEIVPRPQPEAEGSKDVWGDWFGGPPGLANIREAGPEAVVPKGKIGEFLKDMMGGMDVSNLAPPSGGLSQKDIEAELKKMTGNIDQPRNQKPGEMNMEQMDGMMKAMKSMSPESLLQLARTSSNEQMSQLASKTYGDMTSRQEVKLKTASPGKSINPETGEEYTPLGDTKPTAAVNPIAELQKQLVGLGAKIKTDGIMGPETMTAIKANMSSMVRDTAKKAEPPLPAPTAKPAASETPPTMPGTGDATLSDVVKSLESLNMLMGQLTAHAAETADNSGATVKATRGLSGNLYAR